MASNVKSRPARRTSRAKVAHRAARPRATRTSPAPAPRFFTRPAQWRAWLERHHATRAELWVGFWRVATGRPSLTWPQSVDEALCFGWIDGLRRGLDTASYMIRFTPRKPGSRWSRVNLKRFAELADEGRVHATGHAARSKWGDDARAGYSHETERAGLDRAGLARLRANARAWRFWQAQVPSYRRMAGHWVVSARREATREARLRTLVDCCAHGRAVPPVAKWVTLKPASGAATGSRPRARRRPRPAR